MRHLNKESTAPFPRTQINQAMHFCQVMGKKLKALLAGFRTEDAQFYVKSISHLKKFCRLIPCLHPLWRVLTWIQICASLNHRKKVKAEPSRLFPRKHTDNLVLLIGVQSQPPPLSIDKWFLCFVSKRAKQSYYEYHKLARNLAVDCLCCNNSVMKFKLFGGP